MPIDNWEEIRTAYHVARLGTVSGAAQVLGVHHATVIRHIDALEGRVGVKLFQRHARGYKATEAGADLLQVAAATDDQFAQMVARIKGLRGGVSGELVITTVAGVSDLLTPILVRFQQEYPETTVRYVTDPRLFRLEYGEAHVAIRAGKKPDEPDNVVQNFLTVPMRLCASQFYVEKHDLPKSDAEFSAHRFVTAAQEESRAPFHQWMTKNVPPECIVYRATEQLAMEAAVTAGVGIGFLSDLRFQTLPDLVEVCEPRPEWQAPLWIVTHIDLHRTAKVQALLGFLKQEIKK